MTNLEIALAYLRAIEAREDSSVFFTSDVVQREFPNRLVPNGATRDLAALREASERGRRVVTSERYEVVNTLEQGSEVALEVIWTATLSVPVGTLPSGASMRAHFGVFLSFREGRIASQRNYDCFEPF
jgi:ketosteroid isomerase-like protein